MNQVSSVAVGQDLLRHQMESVKVSFLFFSLEPLVHSGKGGGWFWEVKGVWLGVEGGVVRGGERGVVRCCREAVPK